MKSKEKIKRLELLDDDDLPLSEIPRKDKKKKKQKANPGSGTIKGILAGFNKREARNSVPNTLLKLLADIAGVGMGTVLLLEKLLRQLVLRLLAQDTTWEMNPDYFGLLGQVPFPIV